MSLNRVIILGNLTRDIELRYTQSGTPIATFALAINRKWHDQSGAEKEEVCFVPVTFFGKPAETLGQYMKKGRPLLVEGRLRQENWEDKNTGQKRSKLSVIGESFSFVGGKKEEDDNGGDGDQEDREPQERRRTTKGKKQPEREPAEEPQLPDEDYGDVPF